MTNFYAKLAKAMSDMANPTKSSMAVVPTRNGGKYQYSYESLTQVLEIVQSALYDNGLIMIQGIEYGADGYELHTSVVDFKEYEAHIMDSRPIKFTGDSQSDGSAETYARRYALKTVFGLCGEDDDGAAASKSQSKAYKPPVASKQPNKSQTKAQEPPQCQEYGEMLKALAEYCDITLTPKNEAWDKWGKGVAKDDAAMCVAVIADIEKALNEQ